MNRSANINSRRPWVASGIEARASEDPRALQSAFIFGPLSTMSVFVMFSIVCIQRFELVGNNDQKQSTRRAAECAPCQSCCSTNSSPLRNCELLRSMREDVGFLTEDKLGIAELPHFRKIQARHLGLRGNSV